MEYSMAVAANEPGTLSNPYADQIISTEDVKWAARRYILIYGDEAPEMALKQVNRLDRQSKIRIAEMFERIRRECARLLKRSESLMIHPVN